MKFGDFYPIWDINGWTFNRDKYNYLTIEGEKDKKVTIYSSNKLTNWVKSPNFKNLWTTEFPYKIKQLFVGDKRANSCRLPKKWKYARLYGYELYDDPTNSSYYLRYFYVQDDCIEMLKKMTPDELHESEIVVHYWWYTDVNKIVDFNSEKKYLVTRILKNDEHIENTISETSYYSIQGAFPAITEPGEYYQHPNGTLYYYLREGEDMNTIDVFVPIDDSKIFFINSTPNLMISNLNFIYANQGIDGVNSNNILIHNCEFRHVNTGFWLYATHNSVVDHCFIEDTGGNGCWFDGNNFTVQNCIIRNVGNIAPFGFAIDFWSETNNTFILNNDISDCPTSLMHFGGNELYEVEKCKNVYIENNHLHHGGYGIVDDIASMFFGFHPRGVIINHNKIHDFYTNNYCGNGILPDTGSSGTLVTNNLVYNLSHSAFNLNFGKEHRVHNNIMALCKAGFSFGDYHTDSYTLDIKNNIVYLTRQDASPIEGPLLNDDVINYFDNNIYYKTENQEIKINGISFKEWQGRGYDQNSLVIDPLFNDPEHGDFSFKSKENANKITFVEFNLTFGVIGDEWRRRSADFTYHDPIVRTIEHPLVGIESFENGENSYFYKRGNINKNPYGFEVGITDEKSFKGSHSFKVQRNDQYSSYSFGFRTNYKNGTAEFTLLMYLNDESIIVFEFILYNWIIMKDGLIRIGYDLGEVIGSYSSNKWIKIGFRAEVGDSIKKDENQKFTFIIDDKEIDHFMQPKTYNCIDYVGITSKGNGIAYFDDVTSKINQYVEPYFNQFPEIIDGESNDKKKGLKKGQIIGIVIGVIAFVAICVIVAIIIVMKKRNIKSSDVDELNNSNL